MLSKFLQYKMINMARGLCALLSIILSSCVYATTLQSVVATPASDGRVDIIMQLDMPPNNPKMFSTDSPPRIAIDFDETQNHWKNRHLTVSSGAVSSVSAIEAGGRTRVIVELFNAEAYTTALEGNKLILSVGSGSIIGAQAQGMIGDEASGTAQHNEISQIDFRRGKSGEGRLIVKFSQDGAATDIRREGQKVIIDMSGVFLPDSLTQRLDVLDFATPVETVEVKPTPMGARMVVRINGPYEQLAYQTGLEYVLEITPPSEVSEKDKNAAEAEYTGEKVTFNFQDVSVRSLLQLISDISGFNVIVADSVRGNLTLRLVNVPWDQALDIILQARGLDKRQRDNVMWIAPTAEIAQREQAQEDARIALQDRTPLVSEYIAINYGSAAEIAGLLTAGAKNAGGGGGKSLGNGFLSARGSVTFDTRTNTLLLNDTTQKIEEIRDLITLLDRPVDQVLIESRIVIADESFGRKLGAKFGISGAYEDQYGNIITTGGSSAAADQLANNALVNRMGGSSSGLPAGTPGGAGSGIQVPSLSNRLNVSLPVAGAAGSFGLAVLTHDYLLDLELSALHTEGRGEVISSPRVITANQREAVIRQGDEVGYVTVSPQSSGTSVPIPNVQFKEVLLELKVTPTITQDKRVYLTMNVKKDEVSDYIQTAIGSVPQINKREINTAVLVENGQTVVLGGVYEFKSRDDLTKVPFLGDIPAIGNLFKSNSRTSDKAELLIFVTPKILEQKKVK